MKCLIALIVLLLLPSSVLAQVAPVPDRMQYQGTLTQPNGNPLPDGTYSVRFSLWDALSGGNELWNQTLNSVEVSNGMTSILLSGFGADVFNPDLWLEIKIGTDAPLTPRQPLVTVPYAFKANRVTDGAITADSIANGTITAEKFAPNVFNPIAWLLNGNTGLAANSFLGTTDLTPLEFRVNGARVMLYRSATTSLYTSVNVLGGNANNAISPGVAGATIAGGGAYLSSGLHLPNEVLADLGTIGGGGGNYARGEGATVAGGMRNIASRATSTVGGGNRNFAGGINSTVSGGTSNDANGEGSTIAGGVDSVANGRGSVVGGGYFNITQGLISTIGGGISNLASGDHATIPGGFQNTAAGTYSFAAGRRAKANHTGAFVWSDSTGGDFPSTAANQFLLRAGGGVGINKNNPTAGALDVNGPVIMTGFRLSTGAGANKVLTSDASGVGTWNVLTSLLGPNSITNAMIQSVDYSKITNVPPNSGTGWSLTGNTGTTASNFLGTTDNQPLVFKANNQRALQIQYVQNSGFLGNNLLGGYWLNSITEGVVGATVFGGVKYLDSDYRNHVTDSFGTVSGGYLNWAGNDNADVGDAAEATVGGGSQNTASGFGATVAGGAGNRAEGQVATVGGGGGNYALGAGATVAGGGLNIARRDSATVGGGERNNAEGLGSTIPGGAANSADGDYSFAAGLRAHANHNGAFVWADQGDPAAPDGTHFDSTAANQFNIRASGGVRIYTNIDLTAGVTLTAGDSTWNSVSDLNAKTNFQPVDVMEVLEKLASLPLTTWNYKANTDIRHIGVMAQDFHAAFGGLGVDDRHISTVDADGVAFAAIQGLYRKLEAKEKRLLSVEAQNAAIKVENAELKARLDALAAAIAELKAERK